VAFLDTLRKVTSFAYDAAETRGRRRQVSSVLRTEDYHADERKRKILSANTRDLARNFEIAAWAIRKHLDYVTSFNFQPKTTDQGYNAELEAFMASAMAKERFDAAKRHPFRRALRIAEACAVKDGDVLWLKLIGGAARGQVQGIEGDRVCTPKDPSAFNPKEWVNGVRIGGDGASLAYAICDRERTGDPKLNRIVSARNVLHRGFYERYDQVRGISPIAAALNRFRDTYEGFEFAHAKLKTAQLFGLKFTRDSDQNPFPQGATPTQDADDDGTDDSGHEVNLTSGIFNLDLDVGENAEILESKTPATETVNFLKLMIHVALKSLDIPYSFFDESFTNFYGSRGGLIQYLKSCEDEIADLQEFADAWATWRLGIAVADGELALPSGKDFNFLDWEFVPAGVPWWDAAKEVRGQAMAIAAGLTSPQRACREAGTNFEKNIDEIAAAMKYAKAKEVPLTFADSTAFAPTIETATDDKAAA
jgi:capsid protein